MAEGLDCKALCEEFARLKGYRIRLVKEAFREKWFVMLKYGDYPPELQDRIRSSHGHLSNEEAAELLLHYGQNLETVMLGHISENNNTEHQVVKTHKKILGKNFRAELAHYRTNSNCVFI